MKQNRLLLGILSIFAISSCTVSEVDDIVAPTPKPKQQIVIEAVEAVQQPVYQPQPQQTSSVLARTLSAQEINGLIVFLAPI
ncbi:MAG: hypothetical protein IKC42_06035, partial [Alistipes sp.]|nr:hypothetical protein [Alistipes sp.]